MQGVYGMVHVSVCGHAWSEWKGVERSCQEIVGSCTKSICMDSDYLEESSQFD